MPSHDAARWRYGLWAVLGGSGVILLVCAIAILKYDTARDVGTAVGPAIAAIAALTGAYFGVQAGSAGRDAAEASRDQAQIQALQFAAVADPERALAVLQIGHPLPPGDGGGGGPGPTTGASAVGKTDEVLDWDIVEEPEAETVTVSESPRTRGATRAAGE